MPDWEKIKFEYIAGGTSYRKLAKKYNVPLSTLERRAKTEDWIKSRRTAQDKAETKLVRKVADARVSDMAKLERGRALLIDKLLRAIEQYPDLPGSRIEQSVTEFMSEKDGKKNPKSKTVRTENDLFKLTGMLERLMTMSGYTPEESGDEKVVIVDDV